MMVVIVPLRNTATEYLNRFTKNIVRVLRVRHTSMKPKSY